MNLNEKATPAKKIEFINKMGRIELIGDYRYDVAVIWKNE